MQPRTTEPSDLIVATRSGKVRGVVDGGVRTWRGIPFAAPPVGPLRFRAPQPPASWEGVRDAADFGALPVQKRGFAAIGGAGRTTPMDEDCLTINISAPLAADGRARPVVVWIYGGGFSLGGARAPLYRGQHLVDHGDVVFVSFHYRVGIFGFSDFSDWSTEDQPIDSNPGLRDQVAALAWVRDNIRAFGGDPDNVTIVGQSAGAMSVVTLMTVPSARGLFHRAFAMSAAGISICTPERHRLFARELLTMLGVDADDRVAAARALRELPAERLNAVAARFFYDVAPDAHPGFLPSSPVIDGAFLPHHPIDAFQAGGAHPVPLVIGTLSREGAMPDKALPVLCSRVNRLEAIFSREDPALRGRIAAAYPGYPSPRTAVDIAGDLNFWLPTILIAEGQARIGDCWVYRIDYATPLTRLVFGEATHGLDLPMLFGTTGEGALGLFDLFRRRRSKAVGERFQQAFLDFVHGRAPPWPRYDPQERTTHVFDEPDHDESDPRHARRLAWGHWRGPM